MHVRRLPTQAIVLGLGLPGFAASTMLFAASAHARDTDSWDQASHIARDALVITAIGLPALQRDWRGDLQAAGSIGASLLTTEALKRSFPERRPDGSDRRSFPSGHTSTSFAAASTIHHRYGWRAGVPAQLVAAFVGVARVQARRHFWYDVVVGAAIGEASGLLLTSKRNSAVRMMPWGDAKGGGIVASVRF